MSDLISRQDALVAQHCLSAVTDCRCAEQKRKGRRMSRLIKWFKNRWDCISHDIDIPIFDAVVCYATIPFFMIVVIAVFVTAPIWGIPYVIYRVWFAE